MHAPRSLAPLLIAAAVGAGCAHGGAGAGSSASAERFASEASRVKAIAFEEDYGDARLIYQALPVGAPQRLALRRKLVEYLVGPLAHVDLEQARKDPAFLGGGD